MNSNPKATAISALALSVILLTTFPAYFTSTLNRVFLIMVASVFFAFEKRREVGSMAPLTGIGDGFTIPMILFR